ncbi:hypothetical protein LTS15_009646 [Exophiala xenobiotica]|nr:hypothetical protein LTS15_009646 [Exophiala xenobiotica]
MSKQSSEKDPAGFCDPAKDFNIKVPVEWASPKGETIEPPKLKWRILPDDFVRGPKSPKVDRVWSKCCGVPSLINELHVGSTKFEQRRAKVNCKVTTRAQTPPYLLGIRATWPPWMKTALSDYTNAANTGVHEVSRFMLLDYNWMGLSDEEKVEIIDIWARDQEAKKPLEEEESSWTFV